MKSKPLNASISVSANSSHYNKVKAQSTSSNMLHTSNWYFDVVHIKTCLIFIGFRHFGPSFPLLLTSCTRQLTAALDRPRWLVHINHQAISWFCFRPVTVRPYLADGVFPNSICCLWLCRRTRILVQHCTNASAQLSADNLARFHIRATADNQE